MENKELVEDIINRQPRLTERDGAPLSDTDVLSNKIGLREKAFCSTKPQKSASLSSGCMPLTLPIYWSLYRRMNVWRSGD
nr:hypothetical protein KXZ65_04625 [Pectobacterium sp. PL152]